MIRRIKRWTSNNPVGPSRVIVCVDLYPSQRPLSWPWRLRVTHCRHTTRRSYPPPMASFSQDDTQLIADLHSLHKKSPKLVKPVKYVVPTTPEITVESWRMNEWKYYDIPSPFPTLARGLFTVEENGEGPRYRIVARGYDKFFNIGEVPWTNVRLCLCTAFNLCFLLFTFLLFLKWSSLETHTKPPYTLTLKSNGCIVFIAALSPSQILITSKHSLGPIQGVSESHAQAGERWLRRHLGQVEKTTEELAEVLWKKNWTAVAEVSYFHSHTLIASTLPAALRR